MREAQVLWMLRGRGGYRESNEHDEVYGVGEERWRTGLLVHGYLKQVTCIAQASFVMSALTDGEITEDGVAITTGGNGNK